jgi:hypothetical protein
MNERLEAKQRWLVLAESGAPVFVTYSPPIGTAVKIITGYGYHNEGAPLTCAFLIVDSGGERDLHTAAALASGPFMQLYDVVKCAEPIVLRFGMGIKFSCAAKTNGKSAVIVLLVDEILGETPYVP